MGTGGAEPPPPPESPLTLTTGISILTKLGLQVKIKVTISSWLNFGRPAYPGRGLRRGEIFWLGLTTASAQCLRLLWALFYYWRYNDVIIETVKVSLWREMLLLLLLPLLLLLLQVRPGLAQVFQRTFGDFWYEFLQPGCPSFLQPTALKHR